MGDGFRRIDLADHEQGPVLLSVVIPRPHDPWGVAACLRGTPWESLVREVDGEAVSHAVHGYATPLVRSLGPHPHAVARRIRVPCALSDGGQCVGASPACVPGAKMPDCFEPPDLPVEVASVVTTVLLDLRAGRHVVVVSGSEFVLL
ncbi:MAG: hypothetical protein EBT79_09160 [Actinobacteria bacterium]|nr:hypothetical protein [Actinomycetota bacterium]NBR67421.1 hypothetical protein [Actinomycetota bacterium]